MGGEVASFGWKGTRRISVGTHYCVLGHLLLETYSYEEQLRIDRAGELCISGSLGSGYLELTFESSDGLA